MERLAYLPLEPMPADTTLPDSIKVKKENEENGALLVLHNLENGEDSIRILIPTSPLRRGTRFLIYSTGNDTTFDTGTYLFDGAASKLQPLKPPVKALYATRPGQKARIPRFLFIRTPRSPPGCPYTLYHWEDALRRSRLVADPVRLFCLPADAE